MVDPERVQTDACPACGMPGQIQQQMPEPGLARLVCQGLNCRVESFVERDFQEGESRE